MPEQTPPSPLLFVKGALRQALEWLPFIKPTLKRWRAALTRLKQAALYLRDFSLVLKYMNWASPRDLYVIEAELIFQYHKIEKGLCLPQPRRFFGADAVQQTARLLSEWEAAGGSLTATPYLGALEALRAYQQTLALTPPPAHLTETIQRTLAQALQNKALNSPSLSTPMPMQATPRETAAMLNQLMVARRSVRAYRADQVPLEILEHCISMAQLSPSACNRQPWHVHVYRDSSQIKQMLSLQNGNSGFGHQLATLLVLTADMRSFFDGSERHEPYVDGGLFAMSLILALQANGLASCCLNWCVAPHIDQQAHLAGDIAEHERIIMYLAVGYAAEFAQVPRSARKSICDITHIH